MLRLLVLLLCVLQLACAGREAERAAPIERSLAFGSAAQTPGEEFAWPTADRPREFVFPRDHGAHPEYQTEWWYYTGHLRTVEGRLFGLQVTFFRRGLVPQPQARESVWASNDIYMAHFCISDLEAGKFYQAERVARGGAGLAGASQADHAVWLLDWSIAPSDSPSLQGEAPTIHGEASTLQGEAPTIHGEASTLHGEASTPQGGSPTPKAGSPTPQAGSPTLQAGSPTAHGEAPTLQAGSPTPQPPPQSSEGLERGSQRTAGVRFELADEVTRMAIDVVARPPEQVVLHGDVPGLSEKGGPGQASYYYSYPRLPANGSLTIEGRTYQVSGDLWMDHEFGSNQLAPDQQGWDWFALQLEDGNALMLFQIRPVDPAGKAVLSGSWIDSAGQVTTLDEDDFTLTGREPWTSPVSGGVYPQVWDIAIPSLELQITVESRLAAQELTTPDSTGITYWEGAVAVSGTHRGEGYLEMTGYVENVGARF